MIDWFILFIKNQIKGSEYVDGMRCRVCRKLFGCKCSAQRFG